MTLPFRERIRRALADAALQRALDDNAERRKAARRVAFASVTDPEALRERARRIRLRSLEQLDSLADTFTATLQERSVTVHRAADAAEACRLVADIVRARGGGGVVKAKSMVTEEIGLNAALDAEGIRPLETDLGEYLVQLRGESPSHIISPVVHLRREEAGATLARALGIPYTTDVEAMTRAVRRALRRAFLEASVGISGVNFGVAETGTLCVVTNEGNGRMVTTLPPVHIAVMGIERLVSTLDELAVMLAVLPRSATGQKISSYVNLIQRPWRIGDADGPAERHAILVDNGRLGVRQTPLAEALLCIRCGACLNACPVYQEIGGHAYASIYPGPIGAVLSPALFGMKAYGELADASTLCGACQEACPVQIDLPTLLLRVRDQSRREFPSRALDAAMSLFAWVTASPRRYRRAQQVVTMGMRVLPRRAGWATVLPPPFSSWTERADFPRFAASPFHQRWQHLAAPSAVRPADPDIAAAKPISARPSEGLVEGFRRELRAVGGEFIECSAEELAERILSVARDAGYDRLLAWDTAPLGFPGLPGRLEQGGVEVVRLGGEHETGPVRNWKDWAEFGAGLTGAVAGIAETGTLVLTSGPGRPQAASLIPWTHLAVLRQSDLHATLAGWIDSEGQLALDDSQAVCLVTGPSRTADIEMTLTLGVHGPGRLVVFLVKDPE